MRQGRGVKRCASLAFADLDTFENKGADKMNSTDVIPLVVYGLPLLGLLGLSLFKPNAGRIGYALVFVLVGCGINYTVSLAYPDNMHAWSQVALLPFYRASMATWLV